ncbi:MAG: DUF2058 family protein [Pseudomonadota bacterium]
MADQLRQLGLAKKTPKKPARKNRRKGAVKPQNKDAGGEITLAAAYSERARDEQRQRDATAREKRLEQQRRKALNDALAKLIKPASLNSQDADIDRFFEYAGKIRKIFVTEEQQQALNRGELGIVTFRGGYHLVLPAIVEQVAEVKEEAVAFRPQVADGDELA